jgi:hypothetical protein
MDLPLTIFVEANREGKRVTRLAHLRQDPSSIFTNRLKKGEGAERQLREAADSHLHLNI